MASIEIVCLVITAGFVGFITSEPEVVSAANIWYIGSGPGNFSTRINDGIMWASAGDTVYVHSGTYYENVVVDKTINLTGENRDTTVINASGIGSAVYISADWVNITGFTTMGSGDEWGEAGIELDKVQNCRVVGNNASHCRGNGITLNVSVYNILADNIVTHQWGSVYFCSSSFNILINNTFTYTYDGIYFYDSDYNTIVDNYFSENTCGIVISYSSHNTVANNTIIDDSRGAMGSVGIYIEYCNYGYNTIIGNTIIENTIPSNSWGIYIRDSSDGYNTFTGNTISSNKYGIYVVLGSSHNTFVGNALSSNNYGIYISESSHNTFIGNGIFSSISHGVHIDSGGYNTLYHNVFIDNNGGGVQATDYVGTNIWNDSYPSGGNYWNDWLTPDFKKGPLQDMNGPDGIVDFNYSLEGGAGARDCYPLTAPPPDAAVPDLEVTGSDITFDPASPVTNGTPVSIGAAIHNIGLGMAKNVTVRFYFGSPGSPGSYQIGSDIHIPSIGGGSSTDVEVQWTANITGTYNIYVVVDPDDTIFEINENNNIAHKALEVIVLEIVPPTPYIKAVGEDIILNWTQPSTIGISHYLIYRATSQTGFDFSSAWVNTSQHDDNGIIPMRTTWNDTGAASGLAPPEYYYIVRTVSASGDVSSTSRTVGKWTKPFLEGRSTFSLPLEPLGTMTVDYYLTDMNGTYIRWMNQTTHTWMKHGEGGVNDTQMKMGEGYEVKFDSQTNYTFTGMPGAMISYDDDILFSGFDPYSEAKNLTVTVDVYGNLTLSWQEPASMGPGDWYEVYYSNSRDGFFKTFGLDHDLACPAIGYGANTTTITDLGASDPGARLYFMVVPFNSLGIRGAGTYSIGVWTEEYLAGYNTIGIPLKMSMDNAADWYCDNVPDTEGINYYIYNEQRWSWHSTRMPADAYDPILVMAEGYQISTSAATKYTFIGR